MSTQYKTVEFDANGDIIPLVLRGSDGRAEVVALFNAANMRHAKVFSSVYQEKKEKISFGKLSENYILDTLRGLIELEIDNVINIDRVKAVEEIRQVLANIRSEFWLEPRLLGHIDFDQNNSLSVCQFLSIKVLHGWVLDPNSAWYDDLKDCTYDQLVKYSRDKKGKCAKACQRLKQAYGGFTDYGLRTLSAELKELDIALLWCSTGLQLLHKSHDILFLHVTDEGIRSTMPQAAWKIFQEKDKDVYFTDELEPVEGQEHITEARKWYKRHKKFKGKEKGESSQQGQPGKSDQQPSDEMSSEVAEAVVLPGQSGKQSSGVAETVVLPGQSGNVSSEVAEAVLLSKDKSSSEAAGSQHNEGKGSLPPEAKSDAAAIGNEEDKSQDGRGKGEDKSEDDKRGEAAQDGVLTGDASDFLSFLENFKDDGCSAYYFKGVVAAFPSQRPMFYVPYEFIMVYNEPLALKIQDQYSRICEDLTKSVVLYLSMNGVDAQDAVLKILGLPDPQSVQLFLDFIGTITLHELYDACGQSQALLSYDARRMALGFLGCIVAKFRTGKCWGGKWSEDNMKVKNKGSVFLIELEIDIAINPDDASADLQKFTTTVLDRLKYKGELLPYFDQLAVDFMFINKCLGHPVKWPRFLELISYPLALKPPLVRASFICNVYIVGDANSSGFPPAFSPMSSRRDCIDWRKYAWDHELLKKVYDYQNDNLFRKYKYFFETWAPIHWHVFKFSRHCIQHIFGYTKGKDFIQKVKDISAVDVLLARTMCKAIALSFRFLVLDCGVDGLFSNVWMHYTGSDYIDKPILEGSLTGLMVKGLVDSILERKVIGYVYSEIELYPEGNVSVSVTFNDADLVKLKDHLSKYHIEFELEDGKLHHGSIFLQKLFDAGTEQSDQRVGVMMQGPYSAQYESVYCLLVEFLGLNRQ